MRLISALTLRRFNMAIEPHHKWWMSIAMFVPQRAETANCRLPCKVFLGVTDQPQLKPHLLQLIKDILGMKRMSSIFSIPSTSLIIPGCLNLLNIDPPHYWMHFWLSPLRLPLGQWLSNCWRPRAMPKERLWIRRGHICECSTDRS